MYKEIFPVFCGKCLSRKEVHNRGCKPFVDEEVESEARKWLRQQSNKFYAVGFDALVKRWEMCINVGGGHVEKYIFFTFKYRMFYILYPLVTCI
jgi:hypothetical protein